MPIVGKTGTAQGKGNFSENDSSIFMSFDQDTNYPYAIGAYVEGRYVIDVPLKAFAADLKPDYAGGFGGDVSPDDPPDPEMSPWDQNDPMVPAAQR